MSGSTALDLREGERVSDRIDARPLVGLVDAGPDVPARRVEGMEAIRAHLSAGSPIWIDIESPSDPEIEQIRMLFPFHPLAVEDVHHAIQRPKLEEYDAHLFIVAFGFQLQEGTTCTSVEVDAFLGAGYLVTFHGEPVGAIDDVAERCRKGLLAFERGADRVLHAILDGLIDTAFPILDALDQRTEEIEHRILKSSDSDLLNEIFSTRKDLLIFRRMLMPHREVLGHLASREYEWVTSPVRMYFRDVYDHVMRVTESADNFRELLDTAVETYLSQAAERTNQVMKLLAIIATLGLPLTVLTSFYGMNFEHLPGAHHPSGVAILVLVMLTIEAGLLVVFRRRGWL
jgi:magnesium transporter